MDTEVDDSTVNVLNMYKEMYMPDESIDTLVEWINFSQEQRKK